MKEETLFKIREELEIRKQKLIDNNNRVKRIKELLKDKNVKEFVELAYIELDDLKINRVVTDDVIALIYSKYIHQINENDTNGLYVYLGTFKYSDEVDVVHGGRDYKVSYDSMDANYRIYQNLELWGSERVLISNCDEFERTHTIINPRKLFYDNVFYQIQKDFFIRAVKTNQESAKKYILRKYSK